ncbi:cytochrome P450 [Aspergillus novofumigatus IBT 16806]|uniref:Cytochrome P450 n=1 Tax=Aspergillus novofumigatus (strain IBT 16806) TaxID=1392255 RepID=A0A2I1BUR1_ASPN1|nr:cytochrome P450 [Aspergillus novofumigatus IBT 16806]PKX89031.1 cytochrome P450 [Aspergillus novofumigatus IBT 16806]
MLALLLVLVVLASYFLVKLRQQRSMFKNLPGPPHHAIWGHFLIMREIASTLPPDATPQLFAHLMRQRYGLGDFFYLDLWPLAPPQLVIAHPELATQIVHKMNLPKESAVMQKWTGPILGEKSMVSANGHDWFIARKSFTPGFQPRKLLQHVPNIVDEALAFADVLKEHALKDDVFRMEDLGARMIFNISAWVILGIKCNAQRDDDEFLELFRKQAALAPQDFWSRYLYDVSPRRHYQKWSNGRALDRYVGCLVDKRVVSGPTAPHTQQVYPPTTAMDKYTRDMLIASVKTLIFAGHDTSASTLCYTYAALSKHPQVLHTLREEHTTLFGSDPSAAANLLRNDPSLVNNLPYTLAVIKEALRLWPPTGVSLRRGQPEQTLLAEGKEWPTYPFAVLVNNCATMRREDLFKDAESFYPERHLVTAPSDPYFVPANAWRPFEKGPRMCLGQTLALMQLKIALVMTVRMFDFEIVYEEGTFMYQVLDVTAKPSLGLPTRVRLIE